MTSVTSSGSFYACVKHQEIQGRRGSKPLLQAAVDTLIKQHLADDRFFAYQLDVGRPSYIARKSDRLAYAEGNKVCLYDLAGRRIVLNVEVPIPNDHQIFELNIMDKAQVVVFSETQDLEAIYTNIEIFILSSAGIIRSITLPPQLASRCSHPLQVYKAHVFKLIKSTVQVIDLQTNTTSTINCADFDENRLATSNLDRSFYVFTSMNDPQRKIPVQAFVYDRVTQQSKIIPITDSEMQLEMLASYIHKGHLFCGVHSVQHDPDEFLFPKTVVLSLITGKIIQKYSPTQEWGAVINCIANDDWFVYIVSNSLNFVWCVDRRINQQKSILSCEPHEQNSISLSKHLLSLSYSSEGLKHFHVIDLSTAESITHVTYSDEGSKDLHFDQGKLVLINLANSTEPTFYIEDYLNPEGDPQGNASATSLSRRVRTLNS